MLKNICVIVMLSSFACFIYGIIYIYYWDIETNTCHMTYMYDYPQYMHIDVQHKEKSPNYGLYYYYEGKEIHSKEKVIFNGAPIIFIPGNGGSHKQVRSLASVSLKKSLSYALSKKLDYFTIGYNEELTGLHGGFLEAQKTYLKKCIKTVLKLYKTAHKTTIILIGHSMGGIIAQSMLADNHMVQVINTIIFISTPLKAPVVNFDWKINEYYEQIDFHLNKQRGINDGKTKINLALNNILLISIGGGNRDLLVYDGLTMSKHLDLHAMTASIPDVWLSCDHLSATWCLELMKVINRFLYSILYTGQNKANIQSFVNDKTLRLENAFHFFAAKNFTKKEEKEFFPYDSSDVKHIWHEDSRTRFTETIYRFKTINFKLLPITNLNTAMFISIDTESYNWIYGCLTLKIVNDSYYCAEAEKLTNYVLKIPNSENRKQLYAYLDFAAISNSNWTHVVVHLPTLTSDRKPTLQVDIHKPKGRILTVPAKYLFTYAATTVINATENGARYYKLLLPNLMASYQSMKFNMHAVSCTKKKLDFSAKLSIPWAQGFEKYYHFTKITAEFIVSVPVNMPKGYNIKDNPIALELFLDSNCQFTISYQTAFSSFLARIVRLYYGHIPAYMVAMLLCALALQIMKSSSVAEMHKTPFYLLQIATSRLLCLVVIDNIIFPIGFDGFPKSVLLTIILYGTAFVILALIISGIYLISLIYVFLANKFNFFATSLNMALNGIVVAISFLFSFILALSIYNFLAKKLNLLAQFIKKLNELIHISAIAFIGISFYFSFGLSLCIGLFYYFQSDVKIYDIKNTTEKYKHINRHILLSGLYVILVLLNLPATIATLKSWHGNPASLTDPTFLPAIIVISCLFLNWQLDKPKKMRFSKIISGLLIFCCFVCLIKCQGSLYRLSFIIAFVFVLTTIQNIISITYLLM